MRKVIVTAYACNPYKGSEEGVGWNWIKMIAGLSEPWVLVAAYHQNDIERYLREHPGELTNVHFLYVWHKPWHYQPTPGWKRIEDSALKPIMNMAYALWLRDAFKLAEQLYQTEHFDLAHQLTYVGFRFPGHLWRLGIPFVWGPVGGLENTPWRFLPLLGWRGAVYYAGRNLINSAQRVMLRSARQAFDRASGVIAATGGIQKEIKRWYNMDSEVICEVGPPDTVVDSIVERTDNEPLRLVWSGEHLPGKALPLLLKALASLPEEMNWQLHVLGEGASGRAWRQLAVDLNLEKQCIWHGGLPRDEALAVMQQGHVFVITSLKDLTSTVLMEALSLGLPVICPDHCGFADVVDGSCGIKIPMNSPEGLIRGMHEAIQQLGADEALRQSLGQGALRRADEFSWQKKQALLGEIYRKAVSGHSA